MVYYRYEYRNRHTGVVLEIPATSLNMARGHLSGPHDWQLLACRDRAGGLCWAAADVELEF